PSNPASPYFLQELTDIAFSAYFKPIGFGWSTKKYRSFIDDLHPYMSDRLFFHSTEDSYVTDILAHVKYCNTNNPYKLEKDYELEFRHFYRQFKGQGITSTSTAPNVPRGRLSGHGDSEEKKN